MGSRRAKGYATGTAASAASAASAFELVGWYVCASMFALKFVSVVVVEVVAVGAVVVLIAVGAHWQRGWSAAAAQVAGGSTG